MVMCLQSGMDVFFNQLKIFLQRVLSYENENLLKMARSVIPIDELKRRRPSDVNTEFEKEFGLLIELMQWFKFEFFEWMNVPLCPKCNSASNFQGCQLETGDSLSDRAEVRICCYVFRKSRRPYCHCIFSFLGI